MAFSLRLARRAGPEVEKPGSARPRASCASRTTCRRSPRSSPAASASAWRSAAPSCAQPKVFLFDEPLSNLDAELRVQMRLELARLHQQIGATMIYVTHDQVEAMTLADKIFVLQSGVVRQAGRPLELYDDPDNRFVAGFIGSPSHELPARQGRRRRPRPASTIAPDGVDGHAGHRTAARATGRRPAPGSRSACAPSTSRSPRRRRGGLPLAVDMEEDLGGVSYLHARTARRPADRARAPRRAAENFEGRAHRRHVAARPRAGLRRGRRARALTGNQTLKPEEENAGETLPEGGRRRDGAAHRVGRSRRGRSRRSSGGTSSAAATACA